MCRCSASAAGAEAARAAGRLWDWDEALRQTEMAQRWSEIGYIGCMSDALPKRRWFTFSLRTLFIVATVAGVWLGYELNWIRQRRAIIADSASCIEYGEARSAPGLLWLFGEPGYAEIRPRYYTPNWFPLFTPAAAQEHRQERRRIRALFPEAETIELDLNPPLLERSAMQARLEEIGDRLADISANPKSAEPQERSKLTRERMILEDRLKLSGD